MRIVQVVGAAAPEKCGVTHYTLRLVRELSAAGVETTIASQPSAVATPVPVQPIGSGDWGLSALVELLKMSRGWRADWLHLQYAPGSYRRRRSVALLPLLARLAPGSPRIAVTLHEYGGWPLRPPRPFAGVANGVLSLLERAGWFDREALTLLSLSDLPTVTNPDHLRVIQQCSPRLAARLRVIPIGPNVGPEAAVEADRPAARAALGVPEGCCVAVFFGFVHPVKGIETLLDAMQRVRAVRRDVRLWIVGGVHSLALRAAEADVYEEKIRGMISGLDLSDVVQFTGYLPDADVARRLRASDLAVLPFNHGLTLKSGSLITCLSFGLPVLGTTGGAVSPLRHDESIWLTPPRDPAALAAALLILASDPARRNRIGGAGAVVGAEFDWPSIARRHVELYNA